MELKEGKRYFIIILFLAITYLSFLIVEPYISTLILSFVLTYLFYPVYSKLNKKIKKDYISAFIVTALILVICILPIIITTNLLIKEAITFSAKGNISGQISDAIVKYTNHSEFSTYLDISSDKVISFLQAAASDIIFNIPAKVIGFIIIIFTTFYLFIYGEQLIEYIKKILPFKNKNEIIKHLGDTTYSIVYGLFIIAIVQFIVASFGLTILKVHSPLIWAAMIAIAVFIPLFGPLIILSPIAILSIIKGDYFTLIGLTVLWVILNLVESIMKVKIIGDKAKINPIIILIGIFGGISLFGFVGVIAGPLVLALMLILIEDYINETSN